MKNLSFYAFDCFHNLYEDCEVRRRAIIQELSLESKVVDIFENSQIRDETIEETFWEKFWINLFSLKTLILSQFDVIMHILRLSTYILPILLTGANWLYWQCDVEVAGAFTISHIQNIKKRPFGGILGAF
jgi:hypothetical protein